MFEVGRLYHRRRDIHGPFGGQQQGGIATPRNFPFIFLFTGSSGHAYGYHDGWTPDGVFRYYGEGQEGPMEFVRGNLAIRDHASNGKDLLLFQTVRGGPECRFLGQFSCATWEETQTPDRNGQLRRALVFHLVPETVTTDAEELATAAEGEEEDLGKLPLDELRKRAYSAANAPPTPSEGKSRAVYYARSELVRRYVLARANGICECCQAQAPFLRRDKTPYLEPHHTRRLSDGGPDHPRWVGAVCPNCHRELHYGESGRQKNAALQEYLRNIETH